ncbi:MAG: tRNA lysidine(34) synthetase TilS [Candidatus Margulisiibacteriota bacterium]
MLKNRFFEAIQEYDLIQPNDLVLVAVSGGPDSVALLNLLATYKDELKINLHVAHLNHLLRKGEAEIDAKYVETLAQKLNIPATTQAIDVQTYANEQGLSIESAAREVRYAFLEKTAKEIGATKIAIGHTADDNIETFLMRFLRGSGMKGLCGIPVKRGKIVRPLIKIWRKDIEDYVGGLKLVPRRDHTNYESKYLRNRVRLKLVPQLKMYNLNIKEIILQTIILLTEDKQYIEDKAEQALEKCIVSYEGGSIALAVDKILKLEGPIQSYVVRLAIERIKGDLTDLTYSHVRSILEGLTKTEKWELHMPAGIFVVGGLGNLTFTRCRPKSINAVPYKYLLPIPGEIKITEVGKTIKATVVNDFDLAKIQREPANIAYADFAYLSKNVVVRNRAEGDKFVPLGMKDSKKLQDLFVDEKVSAEMRDLIPLVENRGSIVWVAGVRLDDRSKVNKNTKKAVRFELI